MGTDIRKEFLGMPRSEAMKFIDLVRRDVLGRMADTMKSSGVRRVFDIDREPKMKDSDIFEIPGTEVSGPIAEITSDNGVKAWIRDGDPLVEANCSMTEYPIDTAEDAFRVETVLTEALDIIYEGGVRTVGYELSDDGDPAAPHFRMMTASVERGINRRIIDEMKSEEKR